MYQKGFCSQSPWCDEDKCQCLQWAEHEEEERLRVIENTKKSKKKWWFLLNDDPEKGGLKLEEYDIQWFDRKELDGNWENESWEERQLDYIDWKGIIIGVIVLAALIIGVYELIISPIFHLPV